MESEALSESPWRHLSSDTFDELLFHMEGFVASETFAGARAGRVFKMGELGLGYYKDTWKPRIECLALSSTCKELRLLLLPNFIPQATSMAAAAAAIPVDAYLPTTYHTLGWSHVLLGSEEAVKQRAELKRMAEQRRLLVLRTRQAFKRLCEFVKENGVLPVTGLDLREGLDPGDWVYLPPPAAASGGAGTSADLQGGGGSSPPPTPPGFVFE